MPVLNYYPHAYIVDGAGAVLTDLGTYIISIQGYSGATRSNQTLTDLAEYLSQHLDNFSMFGGSCIACAGSAENMMLSTVAVPVIDIKVITSDYPTSCKIKLVFPDNGDYLIGIPDNFAATGAGSSLLAYDANDNPIFNTDALEIPGSVNALTPSSYAANTFVPRMVANEYITDSGFTIPTGTMNDYRVVASYGSRYNAIYRTANKRLYQFLNRHTPNVPPTPEDTDPYAPGGISGPGGGTGTFSDTSTPIDFPPLPNISVEDTGFINLWNPSASQLRLLADYMWDTSLFDLDTWHKLFADPMDAILGLSIVPVTIPNGATQFVIVGNITTTIPMTRAGAQFIEVDCGSLLIEEKWGAYLDYSPYTKAELYLPYCGTHSIDVDNIMGKTVHIKYHVDILSGSCCAYVKCGDSILYSFIGQCSSSIPVNGADFTTMINGVIQAATAVGSMVPSGGMAAPMAAPNLAQMVPNVLKPEIEKSGSMSGTGGMLALQTPYLILTRPNQALPARQNHYTGYPSFITQTLGDLSGYTEVELIHLEGIPATGDELDELENILKSGVIF